MHLHSVSLCVHSFFFFFFVSGPCPLYEETKTLDESLYYVVHREGIDVIKCWIAIMHRSLLDNAWESKWHSRGCNIVIHNFYCTTAQISKLFFPCNQESVFQPIRMWRQTWRHFRWRLIRRAKSLCSGPMADPTGL